MKDVKKINVRSMVLCSMFAALSAALSPITIPIGTVPISMIHVSVLTAAGLLGARYGALSQLVFVLLGAAGLPVFSNFRGGLAMISGPTGGFIISYIFCAFTVGVIAERFGKSVVTLMLAMYAGWVVTYVLGVAWFMLITGSNLSAALTVCVIPFLVFDIPKTILSALLVNRLSHSGSA